MSKGENKAQNAEGVKRKSRRRKKRLKIIIPVVLVAVILVAVKSFSGDENTAIPVYTDLVSTDRKSTRLNSSHMA